MAEEAGAEPEPVQPFLTVHTMHPIHPLRSFEAPTEHLHAGQQYQSYERTRFMEKGNEVELPQQQRREKQKQQEQQPKMQEDILMADRAVQVAGRAQPMQHADIVSQKSSYALNSLMVLADAAVERLRQEQAAEAEERASTIIDGDAMDTSVDERQSVMFQQQGQQRQQQQHIQKWQQDQQQQYQYQQQEQQRQYQPYQRQHQDQQQQYQYQQQEHQRQYQQQGQEQHQQYYHQEQQRQHEQQHQGQQQQYEQEHQGQQQQYQQEHQRLQQQPELQLQQHQSQSQNQPVYLNAPIMSVMPPVVWIMKADHRTRLKFIVDVVNINNEPYIQLDKHHLLRATYAEWLLNGSNETVRQERYRDWTSVRHQGRPSILYELYPIGQYAYTPANGRRKKSPQEYRPFLDPYGRVYLTGENKVLKDSPVIPLQISTEIEGWEMEAICRLDPDICHQDFVDRMVFDHGPTVTAGTSGGKTVNAKSRPGKGTLNHRRRRDRMKMRVLPWPLPGQLSYSDAQVVKQLDDWGKANNSTARMEDLTKEEIDIQCAILYGGHLERSGSKAQDDQTRLKTFQTNLALVRTAYPDDSEEVKMVQGRIDELLAKMQSVQKQGDLGSEIR
ncbi:uncharacterized protein HMPREF1120_04678 [Exophiala dermatitidis NIH/UT8656]|uniref:Uncharacterized protein n=2 Tax=Exophiala dermatitidis TaxID=5970 RepID=H6BXY0_EXODN|nr:uncharacterized protein HMPREF1120_04678 [Exophiala dermatitidis NIH/UT8656]EHY56602.1 hypothetical protein HMPREF1120_04678 [Exophiala dermatitidis NIH/UT8656]KAJ4520328.1 hypothetical protein HRR75_002193 [Exophiala dermatitidis]KAJ4556302.1 hypothetical protein HRR78_001961 [Exophiala dermatitidis]